MKVELTKNILALRTAVAYLGEKNLWWNSKFYDNNSTSFLEYAFPKSKNAQFSCANIPARAFVDNAVGSNYYHLFRLPVSVEELLNKNDRALPIETVKTEDEAMTLLIEIADNLSISDNSGPKNIGSISRLDSETIQAFAAEYLSAFKNNYQVHPYLN